jgi:Skp family chaperone for outer membrane proteins
MPTSVSTAVVANFSQYKLEIHVQRALQKAWLLSGGRPLNAGHLLKGALLVGRTVRSSAFQKIAFLLPLTNLEDVKVTEIPPADLAALPLTKPLADSCSVAESFLKDKDIIWGRDYITIALLAKDDPSLAEIANEAGTNMQAILPAWFEFVTSGGKRRTRDAWQRWWRGAGVALATEESKPTKSSSAFLLTWNPKLFPFPDLQHHVEEIDKKGFSTVRWSTGNRRSISTGTRVFLMRQGEEPRGLVGVGNVTSEAMDAPHWDETKRQEGAKSLLVNVRWTALSREPFVDLPRLVRQTDESSIWSSRSSGVQLKPALTQRLEEIWPHAWAEHVRNLHALPDIQPKEWIAPFDADRGGKDDSLKLERYINAFGRVMASSNLKPPLSIGLFGDWGSGKSFFMDRLYDKIQELSKEGNKETSLYLPRICQIRFNAWHYTETNLWASLVSTIFNELRFFLDGRKDDADEFNKILNQLELAGELRKAAEERVNKAAQEHTNARKKVEEAEKQLRELPPPPELSGEQLQLILKEKVTEVIKDTDPENFVELLDSATKWSGREEFKEASERITSGKATVEEVAALLDEARTLSSQAGFWWRVLCGANIQRTKGFWIVAATLLMIPFVFLLASRLGMQQGWASLWTLLGEFLTAAGAIIAWARSCLSGSSTVFDRLRPLQAKITRSIDDARSKDRLAYEKQRDDALTKEKEYQTHLEQAQREEQQAAEEERKAREALRDSTSQARLGRFIRERASSADYEKHLGLIAMIHRDFSRLSELMEKAGKNQTDTEKNEADVKLPRIDRIILYIDDLDRCHPPEKVVKVLEAVHLLLFFPLFVVVVGVDSRWVSRALHKYYEGMLADETITAKGGANTVGRPPAASQDFLEKIFQVPFWLRRMEPSAVQRLIHSLISPQELESQTQTVVLPQPPIAGGISGAAQSESTTDEASTDVEQSGTSAEDANRAVKKKITNEAESEKLAINEPMVVPSESLTVTEAELSFMDRVAPLMPRSPRSVKRFVNIYRLYKAALSPPAFARFVGTQAQPGNFRAVQVLLALVTGTPRLAQKVFQELQTGENASKKRLSELAKIDEGDESGQATLEALREFAKGDCDLPLDALRDVSALVARYSLHHMISSAPGEAGLG